MNLRWSHANETIIGPWSWIGLWTTRTARSNVCSGIWWTRWRSVFRPAIFVRYSSRLTGAGSRVTNNPATGT